mgnify:CR=1 FL=1
MDSRETHMEIDQKGYKLILPKRYSFKVADGYEYMGEDVQAILIDKTRKIEYLINRQDYTYEKDDYKETTQDLSIFYKFSDLEDWTLLFQMNADVKDRFAEALAITVKQAYLEIDMIHKGQLKIEHADLKFPIMGKPEVRRESAMIYNGEFEAPNLDIMMTYPNPSVGIELYPDIWSDDPAKNYVASWSGAATHQTGSKELLLELIKLIRTTEFREL